MASTCDPGFVLTDISKAFVSDLISASCSIGFSMLQQLAGKLAAVPAGGQPAADKQPAAGQQADSCCAELLAYNTSPGADLPPLLILVLLVLVQQIHHLIQYDTHRGMTQLEIYLKHLQAAAQTDEGSAVKYRALVLQLQLLQELPDSIACQAALGGEGATAAGGTTNSSSSQEAWRRSRRYQLMYALEPCTCAATWQFEGAASSSIPHAVLEAARGIVALTEGISCSSSSANTASSSANTAGSSASSASSSHSNSSSGCESSSTSGLGRFDILQEQLNILQLQEAVRVPAQRVGLWHFAVLPGTHAAWPAACEPGGSTRLVAAWQVPSGANDMH